MKSVFKDIYEYKSNNIARWTAESYAVEHDLGLPNATVSNVQIVKSPAHEPYVSFNVKMKLKTYEKWAERYCALLNAYKYRKVKK